MHHIMRQVAVLVGWGLDPLLGPESVFISSNLTGCYWGHQERIWQTGGNLIKISVINNSDLSDKIAQSETEESARHKLNLKAECEPWGLRSSAGPGIVWDIRWIFNCICFIATYNIYLCFIGSPLNPINSEYNLTKECRQQTPIFATNLPGVFRLSLLCIIISALSWSPWFWYLVGVGSSAGLGCMRRWVSVLWHPRLPPRLRWTQTCCYDREQGLVQDNYYLMDGEGEGESEPQSHITCLTACCMLG